MNDLLTVQDLVARYPGTTPGAWANRRYKGTGPKFLKLGRRIMYRVSDVVAWEEENAHTCTSEYEVA
ncbi:helix-turn-helix transcriptional regulator [Corynebacterium sp. Marseille-Q2823]|uniref:helix-turn-helix transcriptional regulator n=1 Tax=Corynebacterium sp. Marseille-Q2823 TaxID=2736606 RepID=UPI0015885A5A|nr:DNA-binding protein [Corynebacterium sp. Marseille-Q2823]